VAAAAPLNEDPFGSPARNELGFADPEFVPHPFDAQSSEIG
jgi:hypothetical protein